MRKILVSFVLLYLRVFAKIQLFKMKLFFKERPIIIGVGGASGKSSLAHLLALLLSEKYKILETEGKNSETGIPLSILKIKVQNYNPLEWLFAFFQVPLRVIFDWEKYGILIVEMGIDGPLEPKNMNYLLKVIKPKIGVLTNISYEHSVYFENVTKDKNRILDLTSRQEALLLESLPKDGTAVLNMDDFKISKIKVKASKISVSAKDAASDFLIEKTESDLKSFKMSFFFKGRGYKIKLPFSLPDHYSYTLVMAIALGKILGFSIEDSIKIIREKFSLPPGRMSVFEGKNDTIILDSSYNNATLLPIIDILDFLKKVSGKRRKVAVIGDMRELGSISREYHEKVANKLLETADLVFLVGPLTGKFIAPVLSKHKHIFYSFNTFSEAKNTIKDKIKKGDIVMVKSSQNTLFLERVVEMFLKNPKDIKKLARRGSFWDKMRAKNP